MLTVGDIVTFREYDATGIMTATEGVVANVGMNACRVAIKGNREKAVLTSSIIRIHIPMGSFETVANYLTEAASI